MMKQSVNGKVESFFGDVIKLNGMEIKCNEKVVAAYGKFFNLHDDVTATVEDGVVTFVKRGGASGGYKRDAYKPTQSEERIHANAQKDKQITYLNLLNRATEMVIATKGKDATKDTLCTDALTLADLMFAQVQDRFHKMEFQGTHPGQ
jgi:hypothetical protein